MSETYGRTDMHSCGCVEDVNGYVIEECAQHRDVDLPEDLAGPEPWAGEHQSTTACCPRETIPDSCSCPDGCSCLCADCDCGTDCDCCRCPDCGRADCTGEDCYWPDEAGLR